MRWLRCSSLALGMASEPSQEAPTVEEFFARIESTYGELASVIDGGSLIRSDVDPRREQRYSLAFRRDAAGHLTLRWDWWELNDDGACTRMVALHCDDRGATTWSKEDAAPREAPSLVAAIERASDCSGYAPLIVAKLLWPSALPIVSLDQWDRLPTIAQEEVLGRRRWTASLALNGAGVSATLDVASGTLIELAVVEADRSRWLMLLAPRLDAVVEEAQLERARPRPPAVPEKPADERRRRRREEKERERQGTAQLLSAAALVAGIALLRIGLALWRWRRPIVVPLYWVWPVVAAFALYELNHFVGRWFVSSSIWITVATLVGVGWFVMAKWREVQTRLVVGGITLRDAHALARAALKALRAPEDVTTDVVEDAEEHTLRLGKSGPAVLVKQNRALGVVWFAMRQPETEAPRTEVLAAIASCLSSEVIDVPRGMAVRYLLAGAFCLAVGSMFLWSTLP